MIPDDDRRWGLLKGGYRIPYDPRPALSRLRSDGADAKAWADLWEHLHHQGDVDDAAYASVAALAGIHGATGLSTANLFALAATVEVERRRRTNPPLPDWLEADYHQAWRDLRHAALRELEHNTEAQTLQHATAVVLLSKGLDQLGALVWYHDDSTLREFLDERLAWTEWYRQ